MDNIDPAIAALINDARDALPAVPDGTIAGRDAAIDVGIGDLQHFKTGISPTGSLRTADLRGLVQEAEPVDPATELVKTVTEYKAAIKEYVWVDLKSKSLEEFIAALQQLPKNEIQLQSITGVGYHVGTKKLAFRRPGI